MQHWAEMCYRKEPINDHFNIFIKRRNGRHEKRKERKKQL